MIYRYLYGGVQYMCIFSNYDQLKKETENLKIKKIRNAIDIAYTFKTHFLLIFLPQ